MVKSFTAPAEYFLGLIPPSPEAIERVPKLHAYLDLDAITVPVAFGHVDNRMIWGSLSNLRVGDCVVAGAMHQVMDWTHAATGTAAPFTDAGAISVYNQISPNDGGVDMLWFAEHWRTVGFPDAKGAVHRIDAYAQITSYDHLMKAAYVFGTCAFGFLVPRSAMTQFGQGHPWTNIGDNSNEGGHYVPVVGRNSAKLGMLVTWGRLQGFTQPFYDRYKILALAYISKDYINPATQLTPEKLNLAQMIADLVALANG